MISFQRIAMLASLMLLAGLGLALAVSVSPSFADDGGAAAPVVDAYHGSLGETAHLAFWVLRLAALPALGALALLLVHRRRWPGVVYRRSDETVTQPPDGLSPGAVSVIRRREGGPAMTLAIFLHLADAGRLRVRGGRDRVSVETAGPDTMADLIAGDPCDQGNAAPSPVEFWRGVAAVSDPLAMQCGEELRAAGYFDDNPVAARFGCRRGLWMGLWIYASAASVVGTALWLALVAPWWAASVAGLLALLPAALVMPMHTGFLVPTEHGQELIARWHAYRQQLAAWSAAGEALNGTDLLHAVALEVRGGARALDAAEPPEWFRADDDTDAAAAFSALLSAYREHRRDEDDE